MPTLDNGALTGALPYAVTLAAAMVIVASRGRITHIVRHAGRRLASRGASSSPTGSTEVVPTTWRSYAAEVPAWLIVLGAMAVSFWTQVKAVIEHGFALWEGLVWGTSTDFGTLACLFLAREGAHRGTPTWGVWVLSIACAVMSVQFNIVDGIERGDWLAVEAHVWMPALALGVWYWTLHGRHRRWSHRRTAEQGAAAAAEPAPEPSAAQPEPAPVRPVRRPAVEGLGLVQAAL